MRKRVVITTPFPTAEDLAETYGISKTQMRKLTALADKILGRDVKKSQQAPPRRRNANGRLAHERDAPRLDSSLGGECLRALDKNPHF
jgi:hypothetical protein